MQLSLLTTVAGSAAIALAAVAEAEPRTPTSRPPNIVFILADDLGYGDLGCYGQTRIRTPNLDALARTGIRFTQCYAGSTVCAPSRSCLITGLHTGHTTVRGNALVPLRPDDPNVARMAQGRGYKTAMIGKWGLGEPGTAGVPNRQGFDLFFGYLNQAVAHNSFPAALWRNGDKVEIHGNEHQRQSVYSNDLFTEEAIRFIETSRRSPFFLCLAYTVPHANSTARTMEAAEIEAEYAGAGWPDAEKRFASSITRMDRQIGRLLERLDRLGIYRDTVVFFTSDNGPHREGAHDPDMFASRGGLRGIKRDLYEGGIRVPMIVRWPGHTPRGAVSREVWAFWDFMPTAADLMGVQPPPRGDGVSALPAILGGTLPARPPLYWEFHERGFEQAVRLGDWKAVRHRSSGPIELYSLRSDCAEERDVASNHPEVVERARTLMRDCRTHSEEFPVRETTR